MRWRRANRLSRHTMLADVIAPDVAQPPNPFLPLGVPVTRWGWLRAAAAPTVFDPDPAGSPHRARSRPNQPLCRTRIKRFSRHNMLAVDLSLVSSPGRRRQRDNSCSRLCAEACVKCRVTVSISWMTRATSSTTPNGSERTTVKPNSRPPPSMMAAPWSFGAASASCGGSIGAWTPEAAQPSTKAVG